MIHKDALRSLHSYYSNEDLVMNSKKASKTRRTREDAQDILSCLQTVVLLPGTQWCDGVLAKKFQWSEWRKSNEYFWRSDPRTVMVNYASTRDFAHLEFDKCLIPVFNAIAFLLNNQHENWNAAELQMTLQSKLSVRSLFLLVGFDMVDSHK